MTFAPDITTQITHLPDHTELPETDGTFVKNFQEHPQSVLLTDSLEPVLQKLHPEGDYAIGQDCGIYWRLTEPLERGAECPDWFYVPNVPPTLDGKVRRSYVLWQEFIAPLIVLEFVSGDGSEERDKTPVFVSEQEGRAKPGKFWIYENVIRTPFYGIYEVSKASIELYHLVDGQYQLLPANERGHYPIPALGVELGIWPGVYQNAELAWLRWWDSDGNLLLTGWEMTKLSEVRLEQERAKSEQAQLVADQERARADQERARADQERAKSQRLAEKLRAAGIDPDL